MPCFRGIHYFDACYLDSECTREILFCLNIETFFIIQVQAVQADEDSSKSKAPAFEDQDDDNEENNLIPFSDVPHGDQVGMDQPVL